MMMGLRNILNGLVTIGFDGQRKLFYFKKPLMPQINAIN